MKRKLTLFLALFFMGIGLVMAQSQVRGTVVDESGEPVIGASVQLKSDKSKGAITDMNGVFTISAPTGGTLIISYVGLKTQEVSASNNMKVTMVADSELLDDVVVVAYGTVKKQSMVGAQSSVTSKQLEKRPITNVSNALSAAAPGIQVTTSSGQPGASAGIRIRGFGSINASSAPLYVVDGSIYGGNISDIAAQDIQSISILKDAAATSLYGSSAGNGVILITTKSGSMSDKGKPRFTFTTNVGVSKRGMAEYEKVDAMQYYPLRWQQWFNQYKYSDGDSDEVAGAWANYSVLNDLKYQPYKGIKTHLVYSGGNWTPSENPQGTHIPLIVMNDGTLNPEITGLLWGDDMNWNDALFHSGLRQEYVLSGGLNTDKMKSYMSLSYLGEDGYKRYSSLNRYSARMNLSYDITKWLNVGTNTSITRGHSESPKTLGTYSANAFGFMSGIAPIYPIHQHDEDGSYILDAIGNKMYDYNPNRPFRGKFNPVYEQTIDKSYSDRDAITNRTFAAINLYKGLTFRTNLAYDLLKSTAKKRYNNIMGDQPQGMLSIDNARYSTITFNQLLEYETALGGGDHQINALLGHESYKYIVETSSMTKDKMFLLGLDEMSNLVNMTDISSSTNNYRKEGYFGRLNYGYKDLYNLSASYRYDGSSRFAPENRWGHFWSVGAGWNISNESFMASTADWLNQLKLRASVGQTGNDAISSYYAYQTLFSMGVNNLDNFGLRFGSLGNLKLVWEKQTAYDLALEFRLFNRLTGTLELFNKESDDLLFAFPLPTSTGIGSMNKNLGKVRNYGLEIDLRYNVLNTKDWNWNLAFNGTIFKNKIVRLPEENRELGIESGTKKWMEGTSIYDFYLNEYMGVDPADGLAMYRIDNEKYPDQADPSKPQFVGVEKEGEKATWTKDGRFVKKHYCGTAIPDLYGGFSTDLRYKDFDFAVQFAYQLGGKVYDSGYQGLMGRRLKSGAAMHVDMLNAWKNPGDITNVPRLDAGSTNYDNLDADRYLISGTSLMLKSVSLGYTLPSKWLKPIDLSSARISIIGENLFLLSKRKGLNPMANYSGVSSAIEYDYAKIISANLSISF